MTIHPVSQAEADRVFSPSDREAAAKRLEPQYRNVRQRFYRNMKKAEASLASYDRRSGTLWDLADFEAHAIAAQLNAGVMAGLERLVP